MPRWGMGEYILQVGLPSEGNFAQYRYVSVDVQPLPEGTVTFDRVNFPERIYASAGDTLNFEVQVAADIDLYYVSLGWMSGDRELIANTFRGHTLENGRVQVAFPVMDTPYEEIHLIAWSHRAGDLNYVEFANQISTTIVLGSPPTPPTSPSEDYPEWDSSAAFDARDRVIYDGRIFEAQWWTRNERPGASPWGAWMEIGTTYSTVYGEASAWTASRVFDTGDLVVYNEQVFRANWWTRNQSPTTPWGPWEFVAYLEQ